ncbi:VOC family protein [Cytobacillus sp. Hm23]
MFRWDGGFIMVSWDRFDEGVEWYTTHMGWECLDQVQTPLGKKAFLKMPRLGVVTVKSFDSDIDHFINETGEEGNVRLCFEIGSIENTLNYFEQHNITYSKQVTLVNGLKTFDFYGFENARFTVFENPTEKDNYPDARLLGFGEVNARIGVTDISNAVDWYTTHLGFLKVIEDREKGYAHLQTEDAYDFNVHQQSLMDNIFLEKIDEPVRGNPAVRTYFDIRPDKFYETYNRLKDQHMELSEIAGNPLEGWGGFHFFDPDGNRINVWSYRMM